MATKAKSGLSNSLLEKPKVSRPGVHAKTKTSKLIASKHYKKKSRGQGS